MKIIKNEQLIKRNSKIGNWTSLGALVVLGIGMYISMTRTDLITYALVALLIGFTMTQIGMYMGNRYGRSPRPDEKLDAALKGLPGDYTMYHYTAPASHLLVGPAGVWVVMPYHQRGQVSFHKNRWRISGGGFFQGYMRIFGQEGLGRPDIEVGSEVNRVQKYLEKELEGSAVPEVKSLIVFTSDDVELDPGDAPTPAFKLKQIKDFFRQQAKEVKMSNLTVQQINTVLNPE